MHKLIRRFDMEHPIEPRPEDDHGTDGSIIMEITVPYGVQPEGMSKATKQALHDILERVSMEHQHYIDKRDSHG